MRLLDGMERGRVALDASEVEAAVVAWLLRKGVRLSGPVSMEVTVEDCGLHCLGPVHVATVYAKTVSQEARP